MIIITEYKMKNLLLFFFFCSSCKILNGRIIRYSSLLLSLRISLRCPRSLGFLSWPSHFKQVCFLIRLSLEIKTMYIVINRRNIKRMYYYRQHQKLIEVYFAQVSIVHYFSLERIVIICNHRNFDSQGEHSFVYQAVKPKIALII